MTGDSRWIRNTRAALFDRIKAFRAVDHDA